MNNMVKNGYMNRVPPERVKVRPHWYIPHFGTTHPRKKKIRVVLDCAAKTGGRCLNDYLYSGPNLANEIIAVLLRARLDEYMFTADITEMYYQVEVPPSQRNWLRVLRWPDGNVEAEPDTYELGVHVSGATSSASVAHYALKRTCEGGAIPYHNYFYVDNILYCSATPASLIEAGREIRQKCQSRGFKLTKFMSNSPDFNLEFATSANNDRLQDALGLQWDIITDELRISTAVAIHQITKRSLLSALSKNFDPLGVTGPLTLKGKTCLQNAFKEKCSWDEPLSEKLQSEIQQWVQRANDVSTVTLPRAMCLLSDNDEKQIHFFSDACLLGYSAVGYMRSTTPGGTQHQVRFIMAKTRVTPLKVRKVRDNDILTDAAISVPRLELNAAHLSVQLYQFVSKRLPVGNIRVYFWTDSTTVLKYLKNETARYKIFVANRVQFIRENSELNSWAYVPTGLNPADDGSRGIQSERWVCGPEFLQEAQSNWPTYPRTANCDFTDEELNEVVRVNATRPVTSWNPNTMFVRYSNWHQSSISLTLFEGIFL